MLKLLKNYILIKLISGGTIKNSSFKHKAEDKLLKQANQTMDLIFKACGINKEIKKVYPTEIYYGSNEYHLDYLCETEDNILRNIEFQSTPITKEVLKRFFAYAASVNFKTNKSIETLVIVTYSTKEKSLEYPLNNETIFRVRIFSLKNIDADKRLERIENKVKNKEKLNKEDIHDIVLLPLMRSKHSTEHIIRKTVKLSNECIVNEEDIIKIKSLQPLMINKFIKNEKLRKKLIGEVNMKIKLFDEIREEGREEGSEEKAIDIAREMLEDNCSIDLIAKYTHLDKAFLENLLLSK